MKAAIFAAILALAQGSTLISPIAYSVPIAISSQFQAQDTLGQYNYGYVNPLSSKAEVRTVDGITRGGYNYVDAEGKLQSVQYTSDAANGFRVAASNLPVAPAVPEVAPLPQPKPVEDTPEVAAAKAKHLVALEEAKVRAEAPVVAAPAPIQTYAFSTPIISTYALPYAAPWIAAPSVAVVHNAAAAPAPIADLPEVVKARAEHLAAVKEVKARN